MAQQNTFVVDLTQQPTANQWPVEKDIIIQGYYGTVLTGSQLQLSTDPNAVALLISVKGDAGGGQSTLLNMSNLNIPVPAGETLYGSGTIVFVFK